MLLRLEWRKQVVYGDEEVEYGDGEVEKERRGNILSGYLWTLLVLEIA